MNELKFELGTIDIVIMILYTVGMIWYGLRKSKRESSEDYFLAGRNMTWPIVGISLFAANISSTTLVGLAGDAYSTGISVYNYEWFAVVILIFFSIFFLPFYLNSRVYTMPEFLERRYDRRSRLYFSATTLVGNVMIETAAPLYIGAVMFERVFPGIPSWIIIVLLALAAAAYTIPGGLSSVVHTEVIQAILLIVGSIILTFFALDAVGGWDNVLAAMDRKYEAGILKNNPDDMLSLIRPANDGSVPWLGLITGLPILGFYFWANNQFMVQRTLSARNLNHGRWGSLFAGLLKVPVIFIMVLPGTIALAMPENIFGHLDNPDLVYPALLFFLLPVVLKGLVLAGLLAAMSSSISATLNSASTLITMDFVRSLRPDMDGKQLVRAGQIATVVLVVLAAAWAPQIKNFDSLFKYLQEALSYIAPPVVAAFLVGMFYKRANGHGAFAGFMAALLVSIGMILMGGSKLATRTVSIAPFTQGLINYKVEPLSKQIVIVTTEDFSYVIQDPPAGLGDSITMIKNAQAAISGGYLFSADTRPEIKDGKLVIGDFAEPIEEEKLLIVGGEVSQQGDDLFVKNGTVLRIYPNVHFLYVATILFLLSTLVIIVVSLLTAPPNREKIENYTWDPAILRRETEELKALPWYQNYRILSIFLVAITAIVVIWFW
ncbi:MAG: sodium:solute symporter [Bacteroidota bacterium]